MRKLFLYASLTALCACMLALLSFGQAVVPPDSLLPSRLASTSAEYVGQLSKVADKTTVALEKHTARYLAKLQKEDLRLCKLLAKKDSVAAKRLYDDASKKYAKLKTDIAGKAERLRRPVGKYMPWADTASISLQLLSSGKLAGKLPVSPATISGTLARVKELQAQFNQTENIKDFIRQRKAYLSETLKQYNLSGELKRYNATAYYYGQQVRDVQDVFTDPSKAERKTLSLLREYGPFKQLMEKNGMLAGLFNVPADYSLTGVEGLQTINQVQQLLNTQIASMGPNAMEAVKSSISAAQSELSKVRNRLGGGGDAVDLPDFKPDQAKTKSLKRRLVYGVNFQTTKGNYYFPSYTDIALTIGVKLNDHFTTGLGMSYKLGFGKDWKHIAFTSEGLGIRSYLDYQLKKGLYITGGAELQYLSAFNSFKELKDYGAWKKSGLIGMSKTVALKSRWLKNTRVSLLFDFLHATQTPATKAIVVRYGYNF